MRVRAWGSVVFALAGLACEGSIPAPQTGGQDASTSHGDDAAIADAAGGDGGSGSGSATGSGSGSGSGSGGFACRNQVPSNQLSSGHHNAGQDCLNSCHNHGFTLAGTLYTSAAGATAIAGGTITVTDATGKTFDVVSQLDGNFYTSTAVTFPVTVIASECPNIEMMTAPLTSKQGGCNNTACHQPNATGRVHLP